MEMPSALGSASSDSRLPSNTSLHVMTASDYGAHQLNRPPTIHEGIRTVLPIGEGSLITGGDDKYIRVWDGEEPKHSFPMCGPSPHNPYSDTQGSFGGYDFQYNRHFERGVPIIDECCLPSHFQCSRNDAPAAVDQNLCHVDSITDLAIAHVHERMVVSTSRDGIVKIWK